MWTVAIVSQKGGVGKSTLAVNLGAAAESHGKAAAIIDLDRQASASDWKRLRGERGPEVVRAPISKLPELLRQAKAQGAALVLIDCAPHTDDTAALAIQHADFVLVPTRPALFDLYAIQHTLALITKGKAAAVVLNGVPPQGTLAKEARAALKGRFPVAPVEVGHRIAFAYSLNDGRSAAELQPAGKAAEEMERLYRWLMKQAKVDSLIPA